MKYSILLLSLLISNSLYAFNSIESFPVEQLRNFTQMSTSEQLAQLESLNIKLYKYSTPESRKSSQVEAISSLKERPKSLLSDPNLKKNIDTNLSIWNGVFISSKDFSSLKASTIILGSDIDMTVFYHEIGHALLDLKKIEQKTIRQPELLKKINNASEKINTVIENEKIDANSLKLFAQRTDWMMTYLRETGIEEAVVNHHLLNLIDAKDFNKKMLILQLHYQFSNCLSTLYSLGQEVDFYTEMTSGYYEMISLDKNLKKAFIQTKDNFTNTIRFFDQVCTLNDQNEIHKQFPQNDKNLRGYKDEKQRILQKLKAVEIDS